MTIPRPRISLAHVLRRVGMRLLEIQVWDVAGTMTFYLLLAVLPAGVALVSAVSVVGLQEQTLSTLGDLAQEIFPSLDPEPYEQALLSLARTGGGVWGIVLGILGSLISASNGVAAFHRALHRVYDTREGRSFLHFRAVVLAETIVLLVVLALVTLVVTVGGDWVPRLGARIGISDGVIWAWEVFKWPVLVALLMVAVSLAYYLFPNVRLPRYRLLTSGSVVVVLVLFGAALAIGRLASVAAGLGQVRGSLNGAIAVLVLLWSANIVVVAGAALDAELLRARQLALGLPAWDRIVLAPRWTRAIKGLERRARRSQGIERRVAEAAISGEPIASRPSTDVVDAHRPWAVTPSPRYVRAILEAAADAVPDAERLPAADPPPSTPSPGSSSPGGSGTAASGSSVSPSSREESAS